LYDRSAFRRRRLASRLAGLPDDAFEHDGQLTKREVRAITLARLAPLPAAWLMSSDYCGGVGLNAIQGAKWKGAERIIAIDRFDSKLDMAKQFGATDLVHATNGDPVAQVQFALFQSLHLKQVRPRGHLQGLDRGIEVAMLLAQTLEFGLQ